VVREGQVVLDCRFDCPPDALFWIFSASKPSDRPRSRGSQIINPPV